MEFPFAINSIFKQEFSKVTSSLVPTYFTGDRKSNGECVLRMSQILDEMGVASAKAQDLKKAITSGEKLRSSDQSVYFLSDLNAKNGRGTVVGLLKVGYKKLYLFDSRGARHEIQALCLLDFYIHESKQRVGCGKLLYEYMLKEENIKPQYLAIDRPSDKLIHFLFKHYGLRTIIPQANHYVVFDEFFSDNDQIENTKKPASNGLTPSSKPKVVASFPALDANGMDNNGYNGLQNDTYGRHAASKPICSMGKILHNPTVEPLQKSSKASSLTHAYAQDELDGASVTSGSGSDNLMDDEMLTKNLFLHSRLW